MTSGLTDDILGCSGVHQQSNNQTVQTQNFGKNQDQNHTNEQSWLLGGTSDTGITDDTNSKAGSQTGQTDGQTGTQLDETGVESLLLFQGGGNQDRDNQTVDGNDTGHNDWNRVFDE